MAKVGAGMLGTGRALLAGLGGRPMREPFQRVLKRRGFDSLLFANPEILAGTLDVVDSVAAHDAFHLSCEAKFGEPGGGRVLLGAFPKEESPGRRSEWLTLAWAATARRKGVCAPRESFGTPVKSSVRPSLRRRLSRGRREQ